jgi:hypothetical protein
MSTGWTPAAKGNIQTYLVYRYRLDTTAAASAVTAMNADAVKPPAVARPGQLGRGDSVRRSLPEEEERSDPDRPESLRRIGRVAVNVVPIDMPRERRTDHWTTRLPVVVALARGSDTKRVLALYVRLGSKAWLVDTKKKAAR